MKIKVTDLQVLLDSEKQGLIFDFDGLDVVVFPKDGVHDYEHPVYVNGRHQRLLYSTPLQDKWYKRERAQSPAGQDWRWLLSLNHPGESLPSHDVLGEKHFKGVFVESEEQAKEVTKMIGNRLGLQMAELIKPIVREPLFKKVSVLFEDGSKLLVE